MLFNSFEFFIFFPVVTVLYFLLPHRWRWLWLLGASCYFYMAFVPVYILILGGTIVIDYFAGLWIEKAEGARRRMFLVLSLVSNTGVLAFFKYFNFLNENLTVLLHGAGYHNPIPYLSILLPIGLSFHTFQAMSYTIEVYRGHQKAERHFGIYSLYVMFYPQLVAGPIERPQNMLHQFHEEHHFDYERLRSGVGLIAWGLFKKMVIADRLSLAANEVFNNVHQYTGISLIIASVFFTFQIYCDFSGYSDIAIGAARAMGFRLMVNFNYPYSSKTINEFWHRWHISLSTWFRDYLYIPLGGNRVVKWRWYYNLFITFLISGLWHGAAWTFVIWGALHGTIIVYENMTKKWRKRLSETIPAVIYTPISVALVFCTAAVAWIFFRANSVGDAFYIVSHLFTGIGAQIQQIAADKYIRNTILYLGQGQGLFLLSVGLIILLEVIQFYMRRHSIMDWVFSRPKPVRYGIYYALVLSILIFGVFSKSKFIYFQF